jgi:ParB family chromosome partitioning protein
VAKQTGSDPYLMLLDPAEVLAHPGNVRQDLGDLTELTRSITDSEVGLVQYPVLAPHEGGFRIVAGHRRLAAAAQAGRKQHCVIRPDLAGKEPEQIAAMLNENTHRQDLTPAEEAAGYEQLALFEGWTPQRIAQQTGREVGYVTSQLAMAKLPTQAHDLAARGQLTLEDAAALEQFAAEPKVMERILNKSTLSGARHVIAEEQRKREAKAKAQQRIEELAKAGAVVIKTPKGYPYQCREISVTGLVDAEGNDLDPHEMATQPGFAAFVWGNGGFPTVEVVCLRPDASGYRPKGYFHTSYESPEQKEAKERERVAAERLREALAAAAEVRQQHVFEVYGTAKATRELAKVATRAAATEPNTLYVEARMWSLLCRLAGVDPEELPDNASADRVNRVIVARWLVHQEHAVLHAGNGWGDAETAVAYLERLVSTTGYSLSEAERTLLDKLHDRLAPPPVPRDEAGQLDRPCEECGADEDELCDPDCPLRELDDAAGEDAAEDAAGDGAAPDLADEAQLASSADR